MKLPEIANIAEIIGSIAIVISLIYVGVQIEDSSRAVRSTSATETSAALSSWYSNLANNRESSELFWKGMTNPESLSPEEKFRFIINAHGLFWLYQSSYYLTQERTLDKEFGETIMKTMLGLRELPGFKVFWDQRGNLFKDDFRRAIDELLANGTTNITVERLYRKPESEKTR
jgi:hypothetical protein